MQCESPITQNGELLYPCGTCFSCLHARSNEWTNRLIHESGYHLHTSFLTLTYDDQHYPGVLVKKDAQDFIKRLRKYYEPKKIKYFLAGEYGKNTNRAHFHLIGFGVRPDSDEITRIWGNGFAHAGTCTGASIRYATKYILEKGNYPKAAAGGPLPPFALMSQGLGIEWAKENLSRILDDQGLRVQGKEHSIPRYYVKKLNITGLDEIAAKRRAEYDEKENEWRERSGSNDMISQVIKARKEKGRTSWARKMLEEQENIH